MARILLVDDDDFTRKMVSHLLTASGHTLIEARNGVEGMEKLSSEMPDIIITDIIMAEKEGLGFIQDIRQRSTTVPIVAISAGGLYSNTNYLQIAESVGANTTLQKPLDANQLLTVISNLLSK